MINTIILAITFCSLYLFFMFTTPVKAPAPVYEVEVSETAAPAKTDEAAAPVAKTEVHETKLNPIDIEVGKKIYTTTCIKCHNKDPNVKGPIGPELIDAPVEVMVVKVRTGRYPEVLPPGFVPKRKTKQMTKFPQYEADVPSIHAYIQSLKK